MVSIVDVAKYIIHNMGEITTMKLHKLCYYSQSWTLVWTDAPLFIEDFMAFACGPVCDNLLKLHKGVFVLKDGVLGDYDAHVYSEVECKNIDFIIKYYGEKYAPYQITHLVHQESPWLEARGNLKFGAECRNVISKESMKEYYQVYYDSALRNSSNKIAEG
ncbi:MAG: DUF4065 domain-containing protein [Clostridiales bacterium]|jgi:uncharacterized phage-associated protein|nr:DUF4065 domain-containing protein [Clostridiales bacterium]